MDGQIVNNSEKYHNHRFNISSIEVRKFVQTLKTTAKHSELISYMILGAVSLQEIIIKDLGLNLEFLIIYLSNTLK